MSTFLQNIAPGISDIGTGYLKGAANTQEKYRQEELTRQKDALETYNKLISSGHWKVVDPEKGANGPGVMSIGGIGWLEPVEIPAWEKAKYEQDEQERQVRLKTSQIGLESHKATLAAQEEARKQQMELHGITRDTALTHLATAKEGTKQASEKKAADKSKIYISDPATGLLIGEIPLDNFEEEVKKLDKLNIPWKAGKPSTAKEPTTAANNAPFELEKDLEFATHDDKKKLLPIPDMSALNSLDTKAKNYGYEVATFEARDKNGRLVYTIPFVLKKGDKLSRIIVASKMKTVYKLSNDDIAKYLNVPREVVDAMIGK